MLGYMLQSERLVNKMRHMFSNVGLNTAQHRQRAEQKLKQKNKDVTEQKMQRYMQREGYETCAYLPFFVLLNYQQM